MKHVDSYNNETFFFHMKTFRFCLKKKTQKCLKKTIFPLKLKIFLPSDSFWNWISSVYQHVNEWKQALNLTHHSYRRLLVLIYWIFRSSATFSNHWLLNLFQFVVRNSLRDQKSENWLHIYSVYHHNRSLNHYSVKKNGLKCVKICRSYS